MNLFVIISVLASLSANVASSRRWSKKKVMCWSGDGSSYRGLVDKSSKGRRCLYWDQVIHSRGAPEGIGAHNYCRNPDQNVMPWCYVRKGKWIMREFCRVPRCSTSTVKPTKRPTVKPTTHSTTRPTIRPTMRPTLKPTTHSTTRPTMRPTMRPTLKPTTHSTTRPTMRPTMRPTLKPSAPVDTERTCGELSVRRMNKIVGGSFIPIESHPWIAAIFYKRRRFLCGGSLISPCWVLTAAHCFPDDEAIKLRHLSVFLGKSAINDTDANREQRFTVEKMIIHQDFNDTSFDNDIALLKIKNSNGGCAIKTASVRTVCLPPPHTQLLPGFTCSIAGFGKEAFGSWTYSQLLKQADVKLLSNTECSGELSYKERITENMQCAASPDWSTDSCKGDSGGPLVCKASGHMFLFGVVSWGDGCAKENKPGVYTRVSNYNKWIAEKSGLFEYTKGLMYPQK